MSSSTASQTSRHPDIRSPLTFRPLSKLFESGGWRLGRHPWKKREGLSQEWFLYFSTWELNLRDWLLCYQCTKDRKVYDCRMLTRFLQSGFTIAFINAPLSRWIMQLSFLRTLTSTSVAAFPWRSEHVAFGIDCLDVQPRSLPEIGRIDMYKYV